MLEIRLSGGLGNQLFQYAFYLYLKNAGNDCLLNASDYKLHNYHYGFELKKVFNIKDEVSFNECNFINSENSIIIRIFKKIYKIEILSEKEFYESPDICLVPSKKFKNDIYFVGNWMNFYYIESISNILKDRLIFKELDDINKNFIKRNLNKNLVSIHVRRGDYLKSEAFGGICNDHYYNDAIAYMKNNVENPFFVFFSDDISWCKEHYKNLNSVFVDWNKGNNSYRDMQLMSMCKHNIIANSSFSWWGAFLNKNIDKIVVAPNKFTKYEEIYPALDPSWKIINVL